MSTFGDFWAGVGKESRAQPGLEPVVLRVDATTTAGNVYLKDEFGVRVDVPRRRLKSSALPPVGAYVFCLKRGGSVYVLGELTAPE